jgi:hypothetical protein
VEQHSQLPGAARSFVLDKRGALIVGASWGVVQAILMSMGVLGVIPSSMNATLALLMIGGLIQTLTTLAWIYGPGLAALMIPAIWCVRRYALGRHAHARIRAALEAAS